MCNRYRLRLPLTDIIAGFSDHGVTVRLPEGAPNVAAGDVAITDTAPMVRQGADGAELVARRWSWPGRNGAPLYNFRSEGRRFPTGRALVPVDAFYEFTSQPPPAPKSARKVRWAFTPAQGGPVLALAALWRPSPAGEAFTLLTVEPGPDVAPIHPRQVVVVEPQAWAGWLNGSAVEADVLRPSPAGTLSVTRDESL